MRSPAHAIGRRGHRMRSSAVQQHSEVKRELVSDRGTCAEGWPGVETVTCTCVQACTRIPASVSSTARTHVIAASIADGGGLGQQALVVPHRIAVLRRRRSRQCHRRKCGRIPGPRPPYLPFLMMMIKI
eukprot:1155728-Pelagomonas_calceolata.AAC.2